MSIKGINVRHNKIVAKYVTSSLQSRAKDRHNSAALEFTLCLKDKRNTELSLRCNELELRKRVEVILNVLCRMYQCSFASTLVIPEGKNHGVNSLFMHAHMALYMKDWDLRDHTFSSLSRVTGWLNRAMSATYQEEISCSLKEMRDPQRTMEYSVKGYASSTFLPEGCLAPVSVQVQNTPLTRTPGEGASSKNLLSFETTKLAHAAFHLQAYLKSNNDNELQAVAQQLYDIELAHKRHAKTTPKIRCVSKRTKPVHKENGIAEVATLIQVELALQPQIQAVQNSHNRAEAEKAFAKRRKRLTRHLRQQDSRRLKQPMRLSAPKAPIRSFTDYAAFAQSKRMRVKDDICMLQILMQGLSPISYTSG